MSIEYRSADWDRYRMDYRDPHRPLEPAEREVAVVDAALSALQAAGVLEQTEYDPDRFAAHRRAVAEGFDIPWTAISPRVQRLLYAINAVVRPPRMLAAGVFCGNTFISNAGAAVGPGACYQAEELIGIEIRPDEADRAERNVRTLDPTGTARVVAADAVQLARGYPHSIDLLYLDASDGRRGKGLYLDILEAAWEKLPPGAVLLAHNSVNGGQAVQPYLDYVRDRTRCRASVNVAIDPEGVEVSRK